MYRQYSGILGGIKHSTGVAGHMGPTKKKTLALVFGAMWVIGPLGDADGLQGAIKLIKQR